ncbi:MAG: hypothetical protein IH591_18625, partial [Bacteroidales bacterium]|nr:hypothetical protein [Bacteroidales bacterium]
ANLFGAYLSFTRHRYAGYTGIILGVSLSLWIIIQVAWISLSSVLQPLYLLIGLVNTYLGWKIMKTVQGIGYSNSTPEKV